MLEHQQSITSVTRFLLPVVGQRPSLLEAENENNLGKNPKGAATLTNATPYMPAPRASKGKSCVRCMNVTG